MTAASFSVYSFYDVEQNLLYIGCTGNMFERLVGHRSQTPWYQDIANVTIQHCATKAEAKALEAELIASRSPRYNINHSTINASGSWSEVVLGRKRSAA